MSTIQFLLLFGFGLLLIVLILATAARMRQRREEAQKRVDAMMRRHVVKGGPLYGTRDVAPYKLDTLPLIFDRSHVSDELPDVKFSPTDEEIADWVNGRKRKKGA